MKNVSTDARTEAAMNRRRTSISLIVAFLIALSWSTPTAAQPTERPTDCTEAMVVGAIFIGHDCGEWASILISGNIIIRKPWSQAIPASRAVRLRERREGSRVTASPTPAPDRERKPESDPLDGPPARDAGNRNRGRTTADGLQVELRCEATPEQTIITNNSDETIIVTEVRSLAGPPVAGEEGAPDPDLAVAPDQTRIYETGAGADPATGGISTSIYDDGRLSKEGARILTSTGESIEARCAS
jgi:hypothetical protein